MDDTYTDGGMTLEDIFTLRRNGMSFGQIGRALGVTRHVVQGQFERHRHKFALILTNADLTARIRARTASITADADAKLASRPRNSTAPRVSGGGARMTTQHPGRSLKPVHGGRADQGECPVTRPHRPALPGVLR